MARPKGSSAALAARRDEAHEMHHNGATFAQIAAALNCTEVAVGQWINGPARPPFPVEQMRRRVFAHLQEERSAAVSTGGRYSVWTTDALPYAFGPGFTDHFKDEGVDAIPSDIFTNTLTEWGCVQDENGVWRVPSAP
ncbi:MAG: hypothetical protein K2Y26_15760 [Gemmatimonadaceae bacterium]|nr:hypothetical protein [Gemmatimonadaceae bacterium]